MTDFPTDQYGYIYDITALNLIVLYLSVSFSIINLFFKSLYKKISNFISFSSKKSPLYYLFTDYSKDHLLSLLSDFKEKEFLKIVLLQKEQSTQSGTELKKILSLNNVEVVSSDIDSLALEALMNRHGNRKKIFISVYETERLNIQFAFTALKAFKKVYKDETFAYEEFLKKQEERNNLIEPIHFSLINLNKSEKKQTLYYDYQLDNDSIFTFKVENGPDGENFYFPNVKNNQWWLGNKDLGIASTNKFDSIKVIKTSSKQLLNGQNPIYLYDVVIDFLNIGSKTVQSVGADQWRLAISNLKNKLSDNTFYINFNDPSFENHFKYEEQSFGSIRFFNEHRSLSNLFIFQNPLFSFTSKEKFKEKLKINLQLFGFGKMNQSLLDRFVPVFQGPIGNDIRVEAINYLHDSPNSEVNYDQKVLLKEFMIRNAKSTDYFQFPNLYQLSELKRDLRNHHTLNDHLTNLFDTKTTSDNSQKRVNFEILEADINIFSIALGSDPVFNLQIAFQTKSLLDKKLFYHQNKKEKTSKKIYLFVYIKDVEFGFKNLKKSLGENFSNIPFFSSKIDADQSKDNVVIITYGDRPFFQLFSEQKEYDFTILAQRQNFLYSVKNEKDFGHLFNEFSLKSSLFEERSKNKLRYLNTSISIKDKSNHSLENIQHNFDNFNDYIFNDEQSFNEYFENNKYNQKSVELFSFNSWWSNRMSYGDRYSSFEAILSLRNKLNIVGFDLEYKNNNADKKEKLSLYWDYFKSLKENSDLLELIQATEHNRWTSFKALNGDLPYPISKLEFNEDLNKLDLNLVYRANGKTISACLTTNKGLNDFKDKMIKKFDERYDFDTKNSSEIIKINRLRLEHKLDNIIYFNDIDTMLFLNILLEGTNFQLTKLR